MSETSSLWPLLCWVEECLSSEVSLVFGCFSVPWLICLLKQLVQQKQEEGTPQTFPWCAPCCLSGSSVDAMLSFRMCCLAGEHPGKKGQWKIAIAAMVAIDGASNLSLGEYEICCSSQLFWWLLLSYVSGDVCTVLRPNIVRARFLWFSLWFCFRVTAVCSNAHQRFCRLWVGAAKKCKVLNFEPCSFHGAVCIYSAWFLVIHLWVLLSAATRSLCLKSCLLLGIAGCYLRGDSLSAWIGYQRVWNLSVVESWTTKPRRTILVHLK